jgi:hypothetical protein
MNGLAKRKADNVVKRDLGTSETPRRCPYRQPRRQTADGVLLPPQGGQCASVHPFPLWLRQAMGAVVARLLGRKPQP